MNVPGDLKYSKSDEWVRVEGNIATVGITDYAQDQLSDIVYVEVTASEGEELAKEDAFGAVESVKAASDLYMPVGGTLAAINEALMDAPEMVNSDPYGEAWMAKFEIADMSEVDALLDAAAYQKYIEERES
jgi:glycine cleavage system H protein